MVICGTFSHFAKLVHTTRLEMYFSKRKDFVTTPCSLSKVAKGTSPSDFALYQVQAVRTEVTKDVFAKWAFAKSVKLC